MNDESLIVHRSMVNALIKLFKLPNAPVGRYVIDHELNKRKDQDIADRINNALRYMAQTGILLKTMDHSNPMWWLAERELPLDESGAPITFQQVTSTWVFDIVPVKESKSSITKTDTVVKMSNDDYIIQEVNRLCVLYGKPVERAHLIRSVIKVAPNLDERFAKMRLAFMCKVNAKLRSWETELGQTLYWPANVDIPGHVTERLGPFMVYTKRPYVRKIKAVSTLDVVKTDDVGSKQDPDTVTELLFSGTVEASPFILHEDMSPIWSIDSNGGLSCFINGECTLSLQPKHALSLRKFLNLTTIDPALV